MGRRKKFEALTILTITMPPELKEAVKAEAKRLGISVSEFIRRVIALEMEKVGKAKEVSK